MGPKKLPAMRLQPMPVPTEDPNRLSQDSVVVELPPSNKFGFAWPAPSPSLSNDQPFSFNSSDVDETDTSEAESFTPSKGGSESSERNTPTNNMELDMNPLDQLNPPAPIPRLPLSRAFSMPTPSQLHHLHNPRRLAPSPDGEWNTSPVPLSPDFAHLHELSLELADSVQAAIQMLLQLSPPQLLDHAKEQLSGCSVSVPTPSMSAMFTSMKHLNYISANMSAFSTEPSNFRPNPDGPFSANPSVSLRPPPVETNFDIGEMLQSIGDSLSGLAAKIGVDLVLFHQDVGMKHVSVKGDEGALSYTLTHIIRQIFGTSLRGDAVEVGLFIDSLSDDTPEDEDEPLEDVLSGPSSRLRCTFYIAHRFSASEPSYRPSSTPPSPTIASLPSPDPSSTCSRLLPSFKTIIMRRLLHELDADFVTNLPPQAFSDGRGTEVTLTLERGSLPEQPSITDPNSATYGQVAEEPTLQELARFAETLRGKKVTLCASTRGSFAHHLSIYLTGWGLDVSHLSVDSLNPTTGGSMSEGVSDAFAFPQTAGPATPAATVPGESTSSPSFVMIDDDVEVLKKRLEKLRLDAATSMPTHSKRRPTLSHRPKSTHLVPRGTGLSLTPVSQNIVIIHFTSLGNYKRVKDTIQQVLSTTHSFSSYLPEVIVIPKPAGPRRVLTALYTATKKPIVDSFFVPIATSPMTPSMHTTSSSFNDSPKGRHSPRPSTSTSQRSNSDRSNKSPKDIITETGHLPSSPLAVSDSMEYFSEAAVKLGTSPSSGMVIQSPNGQPAGIFFLPGAKGTGLGLGLSVPKSSAATTPSTERDRTIIGVSPRSASDDMKSLGSASVTYFPSFNPNQRSPRPPISTSVSDASNVSSSGKPTSSPTNTTPQANGLNPLTKKRSSEGVTQNTSSPPSSPGARSPAAGPTRRGANGRRITLGEKGENKPTTPPAAVPPKRIKVGQDGNIVPPISVLIVDDNPINQTILSTFMRKKKIKYDVAKNGEEAVQKWKSGVFHLILMDIQMPVMDGIQATKEIRRTEKQNGAVGFPGTPTSEGQTTPSDVSTDSRTASTPYRSSVIIVALTASSLQSDRVAALAAGCNDFLTKPVSLHWLNSKIIEWGSIKALQMWADIRPEVVKNFSNGQVAQAQNVARRLHVPEGRTTPSRSPPRSRSRSSSLTKAEASVKPPTSALSRRTVLIESAASSPETELLGAETVAQVVGAPLTVAERFPNTNNDMVSLDEEYLPPHDGFKVERTNGDAHAPAEQ